MYGIMFELSLNGLFFMGLEYMQLDLYESSPVCIDTYMELGLYAIRPILEYYIK